MKTLHLSIIVSGVAISILAYLLLVPTTDTISFKFYGKGSASYYEIGYVPIHEGIPKKIFVKYVLPDLSPSGGTYHMNFSSPYSIKFAIPDNFEVTYNNTTICPVSYTMSHPNVFFYDFIFKIK